MLKKRPLPAPPRSQGACSRQIQRREARPVYLIFGVVAKIVNPDFKAPLNLPKGRR